MGSATAAGQIGTILIAGQIATILIVIIGFTAVVVLSRLNARHLIERWDAHRDLERAQRVAMIREALRPARRREHPLILVVEDNESMMALTTRQLEAQGYAVRPAGSAEAALISLATSPGDLPDLIVVDMRLPRMPGADLVKQLRWAGCRMPIIGYSAYGSGLGEDGQRPDAITAGCNEFVTKGAKDPASGENSLLVMIARWLEIIQNLERRWEA